MSKKLLMNTNANTQDNYKRYYQEYEGTFITATDKSEDDTIDTSRFVEVTEIWGNTIQDENNLEDIQSIGELYVDEQGEPILDELGREQYKIEIESCNCINLFNKSDITVNGADSISNIFIPVVEGEKITSTSSRSDGWMKFDLYDINKIKKYSNFGNIQSNKCTITIPNNIHFIKPVFSTLAMFDAMTIRGDRILKYESFIPQVQNKTTILLPCQLQKVGDVYDRLYWDSEKGRYVVEKKIGVTEFDNENWNLIANKEKVILFGKFDNLLGIEWDLVITGRKNSSLCSLSTWVDVNMISDRNGHRLLTNRQFTIQVVKTDLISEDLEGFKDYLSTKHKILYYPFRNSQLIETNITEKIQLPCYSEKTHVFVNSTVDASMKVLVPYKEII